ncbi:hypothetical protein Tco_1127378 [Tanacetum coccineum]
MNRAGEGSSAVPWKKRARKANEASCSEFGEVVSVTLIHQANQKCLSETITSCPKGTAGTATIGLRPANVRREVRVVYSDAHSFHSVHNEYNDEDVTRRYVLGWGLREDLRICSYRACKELISHMATLAKDEVLRNLSNGEVVRRTYQSLGRSILSQAELLKREIQTNDGQSKKLALMKNAHSQCSDRERELMDSLKDMEKERDDWIKTASN